MLQYPHIDPVAFKLGPVAVHWYGLMYLVGFLGAWLVGRYRAPLSDPAWTNDEVADILFYGALGVVLGGRIGYMLFYNLPTFIHSPLTLFKVWQGGMSFHGGLLGVMIALALFAKQKQKAFFAVTDFVAPLVPIGLAAGRLGNFINGELWGRVTDVPWAMVFPYGGPLPRHPSQIYEFLLEGVLLFSVLWIYSSKKRPIMSVSALFLVGYACARIFAEFFRNPDPQLGYLAFGWLTMGQLLSLPMLILGIFMLTKAYKRKG